MIVGAEAEAKRIQWNQHPFLPIVVWWWWWWWCTVFACLFLNVIWSQQVTPPHIIAATIVQKRMFRRERRLESFTCDRIIKRYSFIQQTTAESVSLSLWNIYMLLLENRAREPLPSVVDFRLFSQFWHSLQKSGSFGQGSERRGGGTRRRSVWQSMTVGPSIRVYFTRSAPLQVDAMVLHV